MIRVLAWTALILLMLGPGCAARRPAPYQAVTEGARNTREADRLNAEASRIMESDPARAERLFRDALTADLFHGPAHNNLGVLHMRRGELYEAAGEFEWAKKLMPGHPDPMMNLGLTLELAGRTDEAISGYAAALLAYPSHIPSMQALARLQVRAARRDDRTPELLKEIAMRGETEEWRDWARREAMRTER